MSQRTSSDEHGFVLLTVLLFIALISALAVSIMADTVSVSREAAARSAAIQRSNALDAALNRAIHALENPADAFLGRVRTSFHGAAWRFDELDIWVELNPESGKLDINAAEFPLIRGVIESLFADDARLSEAILARLSSWRSAGRRFEFVEALLPPVDRLRYPVEIIRRTFTVMTGQRGFDPVSASQALLAAIPGQTPSDIAALVAARTAGKLDNSSLSSPIQALIARELPLYTVAAQLASHEVFARREAIVLIENNSQAARILSWRDVVKPLSKAAGEIIQR